MYSQMCVEPGHRQVFLPHDLGALSWKNLSTEFLDWTMFEILVANDQIADALAERCELFA